MFISPGNQLVNRKRFNLLMPQPGGVVPPIGPVTLVSRVIETTGLEVPSHTTGPFVPVPSGDNRLIIGFTCPINGSAPAPTIDTLEFSGPGGTPFLPFGASQLLFFNAGRLQVGYYAPGPNEASNVSSSWTNGCLEGFVGGLTFENVDQVDPVGNYATNAGATSSTDFQMSITVPGMITGQKALAIFGLGNLNLTPGSFYEMPGTSLVLESYGLLVWGAAVLFEAPSDGDHVIECGVENPAGSVVSWRSIGMTLNQAT